MSAKEFTEWQHYYKIEPFASDRDEVMSAKHMQLYANVNRSEDTQPFEIEDFMLTVVKHKKTLDNQIATTMKKMMRG